ncbi:MAG: 1-acyl-sn-glycerol-3-phosphate acyltransferase [Dysgonamonadaceae bacterium]|jgi:1-acyl-sn-glycerol-3-phosphate acyltransferase|nr:1-acyl-sn-glycerol-3-phosphate acyltransferase [Dysgonamonadaceae bacterium]
MSNLFIKIFIFLKRRKLLLWLVLAGMVALLAVSASRISFVEDISSFLPNDADNKQINEAYQHIGAANKIIVTFSQNDTINDVDADLLAEAATRFAEILQESDSARHIEALMYEVDNEKLNEVTNFITQNLPLFLEEEDYARIDTLIRPQNIESLLKADKELLTSPMGGFVREIIVRDPLHFSENALKKLEGFKQNDGYNTDNGFIFNNKEECLVIITSKYSVSETANNKLLANEIYSAANKTVKEFSGEIKVTPFGATLVSITNAEQLKSDSVFAVSIALILILVLLFYFFRNVKALFFIALSVVFGALFSLGVIVLFKSTVSIIAIGIASIILGIAINYPLHFLAHNQHVADVKRTLKEVVNPLLIGNITTVGAFLSLLFISSDAMKDLGLFASLLLVGTILFVLLFLPHLLTLKPDKCLNPFRFGRLAEFSPEKNKIIVYVFLIFTVILFFFSFGTKFETNLQEINYMTVEQRAEMNKLIEENQGKGETLYVITTGKTIDDALENYERYCLFDTSVNVSGIGNFFPSQELQKQKNERWKEFWKNRKDIVIKNINQTSEKQGFNKGVFENFVEALNTDFQPQDFEYFAPIYKNMGENYFSISDDKTFIYTILNCNEKQIKSIENQFSKQEDSVFTFDDTSIAIKMVNALSKDFNNVLYLCGFIVFVFLFFSFGRIELAILTFVPLTVGWVWILGLMNIFDLKFNIVNIILATFIFGQGDDYTIFVTEGLIYEYTYRKKMLASFKNSIILSATILFIAIGMLIFAKHPAMRSLAQLTIVGMVTVVACAYLFPPLIFKFLTTKKGNPREAPWTLKRFWMMTYAFVVFLAGSLLTTVYGFILLGFRKKHRENNKLRYHNFLKKIAEFVIQRVPGVKFHYENLSGETFDKPAIIISNHQSHLDLMCLMMLTPKLIILTNDWVWRSPFYGRIIRYADFYPVSQGIENSIDRLSNAVQRGYSIVIFPEGTRSPDCNIGRFHRGAFYLAERLKLDIVPVFLHGVGHVLPKNDFLLREGKITVETHRRITLDDSRFATDYAMRAKQIRRYYRNTFAEMCRKIETREYFQSFVLYNYMYKGNEIWHGAKKELENLKGLKDWDKGVSHTSAGALIENNGYGVFSFLYALANKETQVIAIEENEDKVAIARACAGLPENLTIYSKSEWKSTSSL